VYCKYRVFLKVLLYHLHVQYSTVDLTELFVV